MCRDIPFGYYYFIIIIIAFIDCVSYGIYCQPNYLYLIIIYGTGWNCQRVNYFIAYYLMGVRLLFN